MSTLEGFAALPADVLLSIILHLTSPSDVVCIAGVCSRIRWVILERNFVWRWIQTSWKAAQRGKALIAWEEHEFMDVKWVPNGGDVNLERYLPLLLGSARLESPKQLVDWLKESLPHTRTQTVVIYLGAGDWCEPIFFAGRSGLSRIVICGFPGAVLRNASIPRPTLEILFPSHQISVLIEGISFANNCAKNTKRVHSILEFGGAELEVTVRDCHFASTQLNAQLLAHSNVRLICQGCIFDASMSKGVWVWDALQAVISNNDFRGLIGRGQAVVVRHQTAAEALEAFVLIQDNRITGTGKDSRWSAISIMPGRTQGGSGVVRFQVLRNVMSRVARGIRVDPRDDGGGGGGDNGASPSKKPKDSSSSDAGGIEVLLESNIITNPIHSGISIFPPCSLEAGIRCIVRGNEISATPSPGISIHLPPHGDMSGLSLEDNILMNTGDSMDSSIAQCIKALSQCTRNLTGKRYTLQPLWSCETCGLTEDQNLGCCEPCAKRCHAGHVGMFLRSALSRHFCDCPECAHPAHCNLFQCDPPLLDIAPHEYSLPKPKV